MPSSLEMLLSKFGPNVPDPRTWGQTTDESGLSSDPWDVARWYTTGAARSPEGGAAFLERLAALGRSLGGISPRALVAPNLRAPASVPRTPGISPRYGLPEGNAAWRAQGANEATRRILEAEAAIKTNLAQGGIRATPDQVWAAAQKFSGPPYHGNFNMSDVRQFVGRVGNVTEDTAVGVGRAPGPPPGPAPSARMPSAPRAVVPPNINPRPSSFGDRAMAFDPPRHPSVVLSRGNALVLKRNDGGYYTLSEAGDILYDGPSLFEATKAFRRIAPEPAARSGLERLLGGGE